MERMAHRENFSALPYVGSYFPNFCIMLTEYIYVRVCVCWRSYKFSTSVRALRDRRVSDYFPSSRRNAIVRDGVVRDNGNRDIRLFLFRFYLGVIETTRSTESSYLFELSGRFDSCIRVAGELPGSTACLIERRLIERDFGTSIFVYASELTLLSKTRGWCPYIDEKLYALTQGVKPKSG